MVRIELDEAIGSGERRSALVVLPVGIRHFELGLLGVAAVRKARLELLQVLDGLRPFLGRHRVLGLAVELLRRPADGLVVLAKAGATRGSKEKQQRDDQRQRDK